MSWLAEELIVPAFMFSREAFGRGDYGGKWFWKVFETNMWEYDELSCPIMRSSFMRRSLNIQRDIKC